MSPVTAEGSLTTPREIATEASSKAEGKKKMWQPTGSNPLSFDPSDRPPSLSPLHLPISFNSIPHSDSLNRLWKLIPLLKSTPLLLEVFIMPHWFLPDSGHSCGFRWHSSGIYQPKYILPQNSVIPMFTPEQSPEWTGTEWHRNAVTGMGIKNCQIWQVLHFQMKNSNKIRIKIGMCSLLVTMLGYCLHGLCAFPNMVINANIARKSEKIGKKE